MLTKEDKIWLTQLATLIIVTLCKVQPGFISNEEEQILNKKLKDLEGL